MNCNCDQPKFINDAITFQPIFYDKSLVSNNYYWFDCITSQINIIQVSIETRQTLPGDSVDRYGASKKIEIIIMGWEWAIMLCYFYAIWSKLCCIMCLLYNCVIFDYIFNVMIWYFNRKWDNYEK